MNDLKSSHVSRGLLQGHVLHLLHFTKECCCDVSKQHQADNSHVNNCFHSFNEPLGSVGAAVGSQVLLGDRPLPPGRLHHPPMRGLHTPDTHHSSSAHPSIPHSAWISSIFHLNCPDTCRISLNKKLPQICPCSSALPKFNYITNNSSH